MCHDGLLCEDHHVLAVGVLWMSALVPGGANGVALKSNWPSSCA